MNPLTVVSWFLEERKVRTACPTLVCKGGARTGRVQRTAALELLWSYIWGYTADNVRKTYWIKRGRDLFMREKENQELYLSGLG